MTLLAALPPAIAVHLAAALAALLLGPLALAARKGSPLHRTAGLAWIALMLAAAISSLFIRDYSRPNLAGYTALHLLTLLTFAGVGGGLWAAMRGRIAAHRRAMRGTYLGGCVIAGLFTLMPQRLLGRLVWHDWLGWL